MNHTGIETVESIGFGYSEKRFELHNNMHTLAYAWFCGDKRESDWFITLEQAHQWKTADAFSTRERKAVLANMP